MRAFHALTLTLLILVATSCAAEIKKEHPAVVIIKEPLCKPPQIEYAQGLCCTDANNNSICDEDEISEKKSRAKNT